MTAKGRMVRFFKNPRFLLWAAGVAIFAISLTVRLLKLSSLTCPIPVDAAYYYSVAENLHSGRGFVIDYVWNYLRGVPHSLPIPSNDYWQPLVSIILALAFAVAPVSWTTAQVVTVVFGSVTAVLAFWFAWRLLDSVLLGLVAGLYIAFLPDAVFASYTTDTPAFFSVFAGATLIAIALGLNELGRKIPPGGASDVPPEPRSSSEGRAFRYFLAAGVLSAPACLVRFDGALLLLTATLALLWFNKAHPRPQTGPHSLLSFPWGWIFIMWGIFLVLISPWLVRNYLAFGSPLAGGFAKSMLIAKYADLFTSQPDKLTLAHYLSEGTSYNIFMKLLTLGHCVNPLTAAYGWPILGLTLWELCAARRTPLGFPVLFHFVFILCLASLVLTLVALKGTFHHMIPVFVPIVPAFALLGFKRGWNHSALWQGVVLLSSVFLALALAALTGIVYPMWCLALPLVLALPVFWFRRSLGHVCIGRLLHFRWGAAALFLALSSISALSIFRSTPENEDYCARRMHLQKNVYAFLERKGIAGHPIFSDNVWHYYYFNHEPAYSIPVDPYVRIKEVADSLGVQNLVVSPGALTRFPDLSEQIEKDTLVVLLAIVYPFEELPDSDLAAGLPKEELEKRWAAIEASLRKIDLPVERVESTMVYGFLDPEVTGRTLSPHDVGRLQHRSGRMLATVGQFQYAIVSFRKAVRCAPEVPDTYYNLARSLFEYGKDIVKETKRPPSLVGEFQEALDNAQKARQMDPSRKDFARLATEIQAKINP